MIRKTIRQLVRFVNIRIYKINLFFKYRIHPLELLPKSPDYFRIYRFFNDHNEMQRWDGGWIYKGEKYPDYLFMGGAAFAIFNTAKPLLQGNGVDIGAGFWPFPGSMPLDAFRGEGASKNITDFTDNSLDYVFSSHCLEHITDWQTELSVWIKKLKPGGRLFLYLPHKDCKIWLPNAPGIADGHKWVPEYKLLEEYYKVNNMKFIHYNEGPDSMMSFSTCVEKFK